MQLTPSTDQEAKLHVSKILAGPFVYSPQWSPCLAQTAIFLNMETVAQRGAIKQGGLFLTWQSCTRLGQKGWATAGQGGFDVETEM